MTIKYSGISKNGTRCGIITYKNGKEDYKADRVLEALNSFDYKFGLISNDEVTEIYVDVWDKDEFDELKEIYLEAKRV